MIDEKKIEEAAEKYAIDTYAFDEPVPTEYKEGIQEVFQTSINWFKENLWHDASEEPKKGKLIIIERKSINDSKILIYELIVSPIPPKRWERTVRIFRYTRWLYIEDLMNGGE